LDEENKTLLIKSTDFGFYILSDANPKSFVKGIKSGAVAIDLRMHLKVDGRIRNRGTAFRVKEDKLAELYKRIESVV
jgi:hypothetical protein